MNTMKAMLTDKEHALHWSDVPFPVLQEDEVLVKVAAAGVNRADLLQREGNYPSPPGCPEWMGLEIAGEVAALGSIARGKGRFQEGDKVCALLGGGGYAEYAAVRYDMLLPPPEGFSLVQAAGLPETYATSYLNLKLEGDLQAGQTFYMPAGGSGLACTAIPMAKAMGAYVISSVRTEEKIAFVKQMGADVVFNSKTEKPSDVLTRCAEEGHAVNLALDCVCGQELGDCLPAMARGGRWVIIAQLGGAFATVPLLTMMQKGLRLVGSTLRSRTPEVKAQILHALEKDIWPLLAAGKMQANICRTFPMQEADAAHRFLQESRNVGKVVLTL